MYDWIKNKISTINSINTKETVALNHKEIGKSPETIKNDKPFINKYNWEGIKRWLKKNWETLCNNCS